MLYAGFDCGGSSTRLLVVDETGHTIHQGQSGAANLVSTPEGRLRNSLSAASRGCPMVDYVCGCFAGLIDLRERERAIGFMMEVFPTAKIRVEPDYAAALQSFDPVADVCIIAGTGSVVCSRGEVGFRKSGGGGYLLGDEGSGFQFGRDLLAFYIRNYEKTSTDARIQVEKVLGQMEPIRALASLYRSSTPASRLARLAKTLALEASRGEYYAVESLDKNFTALSNVVGGHIESYLSDQRHIRIGLAGGIWQGPSIMKNRFKEILSARLPNFELEFDVPARPPVQGAVQLAKEIAVGH